MRTINELHDRIGFLSMRLAKTLANPLIPADTKLTVKKFEQQTIANLRAEHDLRVANLERYTSRSLAGA